MNLPLAGLDIGIFVAYFVGIAVLGLIASRKAGRTKRDYFLAGDKLPWWMVGGSIVAANILSHHFVSIMGTAYFLGFAAMNIAWPAVFTGLFALLWIFLPYYLRNGFYTMPEFLDRRFGGPTRAVYGVLILLTYVFVEIAAGAPLKTGCVGEGRRRVRLLDLRRWGTTGFIGRLQTRGITETALAAGVPLIAMDLSDEQLNGSLLPARVSEIRPDSCLAGRMAAEHLLERGFRNFGYCGYAGRTWSERRQQGFCRRLDEAGFPCHVYQAKHPLKMFLPWQRECAAVVDWLRGLPKPLGIMACNDVRGRQVLEASTLGDMPVPYEVAVVGADDDQLLCDLSSPSLSSVAFNARQAGYRAAELLDGLMSRRLKRPQRIDVEPLWVVPRQSTDAIAVDDAEVATALRYIRENARRPIGVRDVVKQLAISRRALEIRFQGTLGRSIREEIERVRLDWTKQLLLETDLAVSKIADHTGFRCPSYLSKVFHRMTGVTLAQYRRDHRAV